MNAWEEEGGKRRSVQEAFIYDSPTIVRGGGCLGGEVVGEEVFRVFI